MKTLSVIISLFIMMGCSTSQVVNKDFNSFYNKYEDDEGVLSFKISKNLAKMVVQDEDAETENFIKKMEKVSFFIAEQNTSRYSHVIENYLPGSVYNDLMIIKDDGSIVVFKMKELKNGHINEIVMTVLSPESFVAVSFAGDFTLDDAKKMTKSVKKSDFEM